MLRLIIKGTVAEASRAAAKRGIGLVHLKHTSREVVGLTNADERDVAAWFVETSEAPFPAGTLLYYQGTQVSRAGTET